MLIILFLENRKPILLRLSQFGMEQQLREPQRKIMIKECKFIILKAHLIYFLHRFDHQVCIIVHEN